MTYYVCLSYDSGYYYYYQYCVSIIKYRVYLVILNYTKYTVMLFIIWENIPF